MNEHISVPWPGCIQPDENVPGWDRNEFVEQMIEMSPEMTPEQVDDMREVARMAHQRRWEVSHGEVRRRFHSRQQAEEWWRNHTP